MAWVFQHIQYLSAFLLLFNIFTLIVAKSILSVFSVLLAVGVAVVEFREDDELC